MNIPSTKLMECWPQWKPPAQPDGLIGQKFGHMTILEELPRRYSQRRVLCRCDCGTTKPARLYDLLHGRTVGCGCWKQQPRNRKERT